ncbi:hypothetical protein H632_c1831p1 [Helicosporidium sp. ATCC 50920]|nr:hypothetical protein H632_c1831p1 [Helicosporidium sp. ATCC 50920]|eukprot:KDD73795.1 hypothetical protein H632_c1831p1 [Helicosporidium sp. ATCC 50920]
MLAATSWNGQTLVWDVQSSASVVPKSATSQDKPILCSEWSSDGSAVFTGGCDGAARLWDLASGSSRQVGAHDGPIRHLSWIGQMNMLVTASWDKSLRYWDLRSPTPAHTQALPERAYALSVQHPLLVVACADRSIQVFNLAQPQTPYKTLTSPLKFQTRCVACFPDTAGYLVGSVEGRVAVQHVEESMAAKNFTFKCHRDGAEVHAINSISFHPQYGTFVTTGSDGGFSFWDKDTKQRLKAMQKTGAPIPCGAYNRDGSLYAYAVSYDWSKGHADHNPASARHHILIHATQESEVKMRPRSATRR